MTLNPARLQWSADGTVTSLDYGDVYFQRGKGPAETDYVFLRGNNLPARFAALGPKCFVVGETGFGTGLNFLATLALFEKTAPQDARLVFISFEKHPILKDDLARILGMFPDHAAAAGALLAQYPPLIAGHHSLFFLAGRVRLQLVLGDVRDTMPGVRMAANAWFLDGFTPWRNPDAWEERVLSCVGEKTAAGGTVATFSGSGRVRSGLESAGFAVTKAKGFGAKRYMTTAIKTGASVTSAPPQKVTVIGAGIAGASAARALADLGCAVTVHEKNAKAGAETSGNPLGVIYPKMTVDPSPGDAWHQAAFCYARSLLTHLGLAEWRPCGVAHLATDASEAARFKDLIARRAPPADYGRLDGDTLLQPLAGMVDPAAFCRALLDHPRIDVRYGSVYALPDAPDHPVVFASGAAIVDDPRFFAFGLTPVRGQVTLLRATAASEKLDHVICHDGYLLPAVNGAHVAGATFQKNRRDTAPDAADDLANVGALNAHLPRYGFSAEDIAGHRAGVRVTTADKLPIVGPVPDAEKTMDAWASLRSGVTPDVGAVYRKNIYVLSGLGAHGLTDAPLAGAILAALLTQTVLPVAAEQLAHLLPERFLWRGLKRRQI